MIDICGPVVFICTTVLLNLSFGIIFPAQLCGSSCILRGGIKEDDQVPCTPTGRLEHKQEGSTYNLALYCIGLKSQSVPTQVRHRLHTPGTSIIIQCRRRGMCVCVCVYFVHVSLFILCCVHKTVSLTFIHHNTFFLEHISAGTCVGGCLRMQWHV